jgi:hypothetical protein
MEKYRVTFTRFVTSTWEIAAEDGDEAERLGREQYEKVRTPNETLRSVDLTWIAPYPSDVGKGPVYDAETGTVTLDCPGGEPLPIQ